MMYVPQHLLQSIADGFSQQTAANKDQIREVEERIQSLGEILAYPIGEQDSDEKARRESLKRFVLPPRKDTLGYPDPHLLTGS